MEAIPPIAENDNGTPDDHLAAAIIALKSAIKRLQAPASLVVDVLAVTRPLDVNANQR